MRHAGTSDQKSMRLRQIAALAVLFALGAIFGMSILQVIPWSSAETVEVESDAVPEDLLLFVLAGQSNMSGRGELPERQEADSRVFVLGNDYRWRIAAEPIDSPRNQVDRVSEDPDAGLGPSMTFAQAILAQRPDARIGLVPCAKGGSTINEWRRSMQDTTLYGACLKRIRAAAPMGSVAGILFFQGESDAFDPAHDPERMLASHDYGAVFTSVIEDLRRDVGGPLVPVVFAQIGSHGPATVLTYWEVIKAQQAAATLSCGAMIMTGDLPLQDPLHFTADSYRTIGKRFGEAYLALTTPEGQCR